MIDQVKELIPFLVRELKDQYDTASEDTKFTVYTVNYEEWDWYYERTDKKTMRILAPSEQAAFDYLGKDTIRSRVTVCTETFKKGDIEKVKNILHIYNAYRIKLCPDDQDKIAKKLTKWLKDNTIKLFNT